MEIGTVSKRVIVASPSIGSGLVLWVQVRGAECCARRDGFSFVVFCWDAEYIEAFEKIDCKVSIS